MWGKQAKLFCVLLAGLLVFGSLEPAVADKADKDLKAVERALEQERQQTQSLQQKSEILKKDLASLNEKMVAAAARVQSTEAEMLDHEIRLLQLQDEEKEKRRQLVKNKDAFVQTLMALQRMARHPPEALLVHPMTPAETVRGAILLRNAVPKIERQAGALKHDLAALNKMVREIATRREGLKKSTRRLKEEQTALASLLANKKTMLSATEVEARRHARKIQDLAQQAKSLKDLLAKIEEERKKERARAKVKVKKAKQHKPQQAIPVAVIPYRGKHPYPVIGRQIHSFGDKEDNGMLRKGIIVESKPGAQVIAPKEGRVVYAGRFRGYGQLLIVEHSGGYHTLLAGMSRIDAETGQDVLSGEPVGIMGGTATDKPGLYIEIRRGGKPIDPLPWLAAERS